MIVLEIILIAVWKNIFGSKYLIIFTYFEIQGIYGIYSLCHDRASSLQLKKIIIYSKLGNLQKISVI